MIQLPFAVIPLPLGTITCGNQQTAKPASHLGEFKAIGMTWRSSGASNLWVRGDFGTSKSIDFMSILAANALAGTTVRLRLGNSQAEVDGSAAPYDSGALPFISPAIIRDDGLYSSHLEIPAVQDVRWWRIDVGGHTGDFEAAKLILGPRLIPTNYYSPGWSRGVQDLGEMELGRWGVIDEKPGLIFRTLAFKFGWMSETDYEEKFGPLVERLGKRGVAFWCFDPTPSLYRQRKSFFGWIRNSPVASHSHDTPAGIRYVKEFEILSML